MENGEKNVTLLTENSEINIADYSGIILLFITDNCSVTLKYPSDKP